MTNLSIDQFERLENIASDGTVVIVKIDGARIVANEKNIYTVMLSGGCLDSEEFFRQDGDNIDQLVKAAISFYAENKRT